MDFRFTAWVVSVVLAWAAGPRLQGQTAEAALFGDALVRKWVMPQIPAGTKVGAESLVTVRCIVDPTGAVTAARVLDSTDRGLNASALAAVRQWYFSPALAAGRPVAESLDVPLMFDPEDPHSLQPPIPPKASPTTPPDTRHQVDPDYPEALQPRQLNGKVTFHCRVDAHGALQSYVVQTASDAGFVFAAIDALKQWEFSPAHQGDLAVGGEVGAEVDFFNATGSARETLAANAITGPDGQPPAVVSTLRSAAAPIMPYAALAAHRAGAADISFRVNERGFPEQIRVEHASAPEFGAALSAAVESWRFDPMDSSDGGGSIPLRVHWTWTADPESAALLAQAQQNRIGTARGLDHPLRPLFRRGPEYPEGAEGVGSAMIDGVICRDGRVRLVRAMSASADAFGWAGAQAFSQWVFEPPTRQGQPAEVRVRLPMQFSPPE